MRAKELYTKVIRNEEAATNFLGYKFRILKKMRGVTMETFQSHLDFICWKNLRSNEGNLFVSFFK